MKKSVIFIFLLFISFTCLSQRIGDYAIQRLDYNLAGGNTELTTRNLLGYSRLSFELVTTSLDAADATIQIQKSNNDANYLDIVGALLTFDSGNNTNFIEIANAKNARYKLVIVVNSVTSGIINIDIAATR